MKPEFKFLFRFRAHSSSTVNSNPRPPHRAPLRSTSSNLPRTRPGILGNIHPTSNNPRGGGGKKRNSSGKHKTTFRNAENNLQSDIPQCNCGLPAVQLTVRKEGPNTGRLFYKCPQPSGSCNFFVWADAPSNKRSQSTSAGNATTSR